MRRICLVFVLVIAATLAENAYKYDLSKAPELFEQFIKDFFKEYKDDEDKAVHYQAFVKNLDRINKLNEKNTHDNYPATYGINPYTDFTDDEKLEFVGLTREKLEALGGNLDEFVIDVIP